MPYHFHGQLRLMFHRHYIFGKLGNLAVLGVLREGHKTDQLEVY